MSANNHLSRRWGAAALLAAGLASSGMAQTAPVAQLLDVRGKVLIKRGAKTLAGSLMVPLQPGDRITVAKGGAAELLFYKGGRRFALGAGMTADVQAAGIVSKGGPLMARNNIPIPQSGGRGPRQLMGYVSRNAVRPGQFAASSPRWTVRAQPVILVWSGEVAAVEQVVRLRKVLPDGSVEREAFLEESVGPKERRFAVAADKLQEGGSYHWSVIALDGEGSGVGRAEAQFSLLSASERESLARLEKQVEAELKRSPTSPAALVALAETYKQYGMLEEAETAYQRVLKLRPNAPHVKLAIRKLWAPDEKM